MSGSIDPSWDPSYPDIELRGADRGGLVDPAHLAVDFGLVTTGDTQIKQLVVRNRGAVALELYGFELLGSPHVLCQQPSQRFSVAPPAMTIAPADGALVRLAYAPDQRAADCAVLHIVSNDPETPVLDVLLQGRGASDELCYDHAPLNFGEVPAGETAVRTFNLGNCGDHPFSVAAIELVAGAPQFFTSQAPSLPSQPVAPGESLALSFGFQFEQPVASWEPDRGVGRVRLTLAHEGRAEVVVELRASTVPPPACELEVLPPVVRFGTVEVGSSRDAELVLWNLGDKACQVWSLNRLYGASSFEVLDHLPPWTIGPNTRQIVHLAFSPTGSGQQDARYEILSDDPRGGRKEFSTEGRGGAIEGCLLEAAPRVLDLGVTRDGVIVRRPFALRNVGDDDCLLRELQLVQPDAHFAVELQTIPFVGLRVAAGEEVSPEIVFYPQGEALRTAQLRVSYQALAFTLERSQLVVDLFGRSAKPRLCLDHDLVDFGAVGAGQRRCTTIGLRNCGPVELDLRGIQLQAGTAPSFTLSRRPTLPSILAPLAEELLQICFQPEVAEELHGSIAIDSDDRSHPLSVIRLAGNTDGSCSARVICTPAEVAFGSQDDDQTEERSVMCTNHGDTAVTVLGAHAVEATSFEVAMAKQVELAPGAQVPLRITRPAGPVHDWSARVEVAAETCGPTPTIVVSAISRTPALDVCGAAATFSAVERWHWRSALEEPRDQVLGTALVANTSDDNGDGRVDSADVPDVIVIAAAPEQAIDGLEVDASTLESLTDARPGFLRILSGDTGRVLVTAGALEHALDAESHPAVADIDGDNRPEIVGVRYLKLEGEPVVPGAPKLRGKASYGELIAFEDDGTVAWISERWYGSDADLANAGAVAIADLDGDGLAEVIYGHNVFDHTGRLLWTASAGSGSVGRGPHCVAVDVDALPDMELLCGRTAYHADGSLLWDRTDLADGLAAVADLTGDGEPELVLDSGSVIVLDARNGATLHGPFTVGEEGDGQGARPAIPALGDLDGDGVLEILLARSDNLIALALEGETLWTQPLSRGRAGATLFDFEGDGSAEVLIADGDGLRALRGEDGEVLLDVDLDASAAGYVTVADVDGDRDAELVVGTSSPLLGRSAGVMVIDESQGWAATRPIFNQRSYHVTNVDSSGTVPLHEQPHWLEASGVNGYGSNQTRCR